MRRFTLQETADAIRTARPPAALRQQLATNEIIDFEREYANRPPRFVAVIVAYRDGMKVDDIAEKFGCSRNTVHRYCRLAGLDHRQKGYDPAVRARTIKMYRDGISIAEIAETLGVSQAYVSKTATEEGINRNKWRREAKR